MKKQLLIFFAACSILFASCTSSSNEDYTVRQDIVSCFATVQNIAETTSDVAGDVRYTILINYTQATIDLTIYNLRLPDGTTLPTTTFAGIPASSDEKGWIKANASVVKPTSNGTLSSQTVEDFQFRLLQRVMNGVYAPALEISFVLDGKYNVYSSKCDQILSGTTNSAGAGDTFQSKSTIYSFSYNVEKKTMDISMLYAQFVSQMPKMSFDLSGIPADMGLGIVNFKIEKIIPTISKTPQEGFPITDLAGIINYNTGFSLNFKCTPAVPQFGGQTFSCSANGTYFDMPDSAQ